MSTRIEAVGGSRGVAADQLRRHNLAAVLERLHLWGPTSRSNLTAATGLNRSTIGDLIGELTSLGLVEEGPGPAGSGPGRPSPLVRIRPEGAVALAVEINVDSIAVATVGLGCHVYGRLRLARARRSTSPEETVRQVARMARPLLRELPPGHVRVGVGAAVAGVARRSDGVVHFSPNLGWRESPIGDLLRRELDIEGQATIANEADLGALGEHRRGADAGIRHMIYVSGEVGIGCGVIADGKPLLGAAGYAGEAGHTLINPDGERCHCGAVGCWETEAGGAALLRRIGISENSTGLKALVSVAERAAQGDQTTLDALSEVGRWLGLGIGNLINVFNPELVVLGGFYQSLYRYLEPTMVEAARTRTLDAPGEVARIARSSLGDDAPLIGAAELLLANVTSDPARVALPTA